MRVEASSSFNVNSDPDLNRETLKMILDNSYDEIFVVDEKGTLLLDEIAEIPLQLQAKLLEVIQIGLILYMMAPFFEFGTKFAVITALVVDP